MSNSFYMQDSRQVVGNDFLWWSIDGGYTTDVSKAEVFTKEKAAQLHKYRETDLPWPTEYIDKRTRLVVDCQYVDYKIAIDLRGFSSD